jgi:SAM-dependent methyltransferase
MDINTQTKLLALNQAFYDQFSNSFSATRGRIQNGVRRVMENIPKQANVFDVGCGNGTLARALITAGFEGSYLGVDMSAGLLSEAETLTEINPQKEIRFQQANLADPNWTGKIPPLSCDWLVSFAVLHHLPGEDFRQRIVAQFKTFLKPGSMVAVSVWQWHNSPRLRKRVLPWSTAGIQPEAVDDGDVLLDWRAGESPGVRYVHTFTEESLSELAYSGGFRVRNSFYSDGKIGNLALYQIWE